MASIKVLISIGMPCRDSCSGAPRAPERIESPRPAVRDRRYKNKHHEKDQRRSTVFERIQLLSSSFKNFMSSRTTVSVL
jgi:hypothetical protein